MSSINGLVPIVHFGGASQYVVSWNNKHVWTCYKISVDVSAFLRRYGTIFTHGKDFWSPLSFL